VAGSVVMLAKDLVSDALRLDLLRGLEELDLAFEMYIVTYLSIN